MYLSSILTIVSAFAAVTVKADNNFLKPPGAGPFGDYEDNPTYKVGDKLDVQWSSDIDRMDLRLWQDYPGAGNGTAFFAVLMTNTRSTSFIWDVSFMNFFSTKVSKGNQAVFYFGLYESGKDGFVSTSHYFNISVPQDNPADPTTTAVGATTTANPTNTAKSTSSSSETTSVEPTATGSSDGGNGGNGSSHLSAGAAAGIGVGATVAGLILLGALGLFLWRRKRAPHVSEAGGQYTIAPQHYGAGSPPTSQLYTSSPSQTQYHPGYTPSEVPATEATPPIEPGHDNTHLAAPHAYVGGSREVHEAP